MCRIPGADGTWMIVRGGMGTITKKLAEMATKAGAKIFLNNGVKNFILEGSGNNKVVKGVVLQNGKKN